jgi:hypothetical protein
MLVVTTVFLLGSHFSRKGRQSKVIYSTKKYVSSSFCIEENILYYPRVHSVRQSSGRYLVCKSGIDSKNGRLHILANCRSMGNVSKKLAEYFTWEMKSIFFSSIPMFFNAVGVTGRPNVDWCESHKPDTIRTNVLGL